MSDQVFGSGGSFSVKDLIAEQYPQAPETEGQLANEAAPEQNGQPAEATPEASQDTQEAESTTGGDLKFAGRFKTEGALFKGATEISNFLGEAMDFSDMSIAEIEAYYNGARKRLSQRNDRPDEGPDASQMILEKLTQLIELQGKRPAEAIKPPETPKDEGISDAELDELFYESPAKALKKLMQSFIAKQTAPAKSPEGQSTTQPTSQPEVPNIDWNPIVARVQNMVDTHGDGDFEALRPVMAELIEKNPVRYLSTREQGIVRAYQDAKALAESRGQLQTITVNRQTSTQKIEKAKQAATIETGRSSREPEPKLSKEEEILNRIFSPKKQKGIWG